MKKVGRKSEDRRALAREAKALVALAFRNGPIENVRAGEFCSTCHGDSRYSHITQNEMHQNHDGSG